MTRIEASGSLSARMEGPHDSNGMVVSLTMAIALGMFLTVLSRRLGLPTLVLLLAGGFLFGPEGIAWIRPSSMDAFLPLIVSLAVGLILFEGGLTLDLKEYRTTTKVVQRLLTVGVLVTWLGTALCLRWVFGTTWSLAILAGSMVIVTGPTVIVPLLRRIQVQPRIHNILHWEGVLIDPVGVFIAILCFEWLAVGEGGMAFFNFGLRTLSGLAIGVGGGWVICEIFKRRWVPDSMLNGFVLGAAVFIFGVTEAVISEAGLLSVTAAGFVVGWKRPPELKQIQRFKADITDLLIGMLFLLLVARLEIQDFKDFGSRGLVILALVMLAVRPLNIFLSTWGAQLNWKEKVFLSWVAPRGIVAASMASLFALALEESGQVQDAKLLEIFVYSVITATVVLQGFTAEWLALWLKLRRPDPTGWMIVGAHPFARRLARFIREKADQEVLILDSNERSAREAREEGLGAIHADALNVEVVEELPEFQKVGHLLALTDNPELNELICSRWTEALGRDNVYCWGPPRAAEGAHAGRQGRIILSKLPRPSVVSGQLADGECLLADQLAGEDDQTFPHGQILMLTRGPSVMPASGEKIQVKKGDHCLLMRRMGGFLSRAIESGGVVDLECADMEDLFQALLHLLVEKEPTLPAAQLLHDLKEQNRVFPTSLGHGVVVPHAYNVHVKRRHCMLARLPAGRMVLSQTGEEVRLVFLLVSPSGDPEGHLETLGEIARFVADETHRQTLMEAPHAGAASSIILNELRLAG